MTHASARPSRALQAALALAQGLPTGCASWPARQANSPRRPESPTRSVHLVQRGGQFVVPGLELGLAHLQPGQHRVAMALPLGIGRQCLVAGAPASRPAAPSRPGCAPRARSCPRAGTRLHGAGGSRPITSGASCHTRATSAPTTAWSVRWLAFSVCTGVRVLAGDGFHHGARRSRARFAASPAGPRAGTGRRCGPGRATRRAAGAPGRPWRRRAGRFAPRSAPGACRPGGSRCAPGSRSIAACGGVQAQPRHRLTHGAHRLAGGMQRAVGPGASRVADIATSLPAMRATSCRSGGSCASAARSYAPATPGRAAPRSSGSGPLRRA